MQTEDKIVITEDEPLQPGDIIEIHFKTLSPVWIKAAHLAAIEWGLRNKPEYELLRYSHGESDLVLTFKIRKTNPIVVTAALIIKAVTIIGIGLLLFLSVDVIYKYKSTPAGQLASVIWPAVALGLLYVFAKKS